MSNLTRVLQYTCQIVQFMTCTFDTRLTRVKMNVSNCLTRVRHCTRVKLHVANHTDFCIDASFNASRFFLTRDSGEEVVQGLWLSEFK
jgi:hypothetical protein